MKERVEVDDGVVEIPGLVILNEAELVGVAVPDEIGVDSEEVVVEAVPLLTQSAGARNPKSTSMQPSGRVPEKTASMEPPESWQKITSTFSKRVFSQTRISLVMLKKVVIFPPGDSKEKTEVVSPSLAEISCPSLNSWPLKSMVKNEAPEHTVVVEPSEATSC